MDNPHIVLLFSFSIYNYHDANKLVEKLNNENTNIYHFIRKIDDKYKIYFKYLYNHHKKIIITI